MPTDYVSIIEDWQNAEVELTPNSWTALQTTITSDFITNYMNTLTESEFTDSKYNNLVTLFVAMQRNYQKAKSLTDYELDLVNDLTTFFIKQSTTEVIAGVDYRRFCTKLLQLFCFHSKYFFGPSSVVGGLAERFEGNSKLLARMVFNVIFRIMSAIQKSNKTELLFICTMEVLKNDSKTQQNQQMCANPHDFLFV